MRVMVLMVLLTGSLLAAEPEIGRVNGEELSLRQLEDELLKREGTDLLKDLIRNHLASVDWSSLGDQDPILELPGYTFRRIDLTSRLLESHGAKVRSELINIMIARQALDAAGVPDNAAVLEAEWVRMKTAFERKLEEDGKPIVPFEEYLRVDREMSKADFMAEEGFRMAARLHHHAVATAEIAEDDLRDHYVQHRIRFIVPEAVQVSVIHIPYKTTKIKGQEVVDQAHVQSLQRTMAKLRRDLVAGKRTFAKTWSLFGKGWDPESTGGLVGWVPRSGRPERQGARVLPEPVIKAAWEADCSAGPVLLPIIAHQRGCDIVRVEKRRAGTDPSFASMRKRVRADYIDEHIDALTRTLSNKLSREAVIEFGEMNKVISRRRRELRQVQQPAASK